MGREDDSAGRLFIGVPLTAEARGEIEEKLRRALPEGLPGRPVPAGNWHLTLRFLGATRADQLAEDAARAAGFAPESKSFTPHLTLSRIQPPRDVTRAIERVPPLDVAMRVGEVVIFRSHLGGGPARYEVIDRFPLR